MLTKNQRRLSSSLALGLSGVLSSFQVQDALAQTPITNSVKYSFQSEGSYGPDRGGLFILKVDDKNLVVKGGGGYGGRGINLVQIDSSSGNLVTVKNYDTWGNGSNHKNFQDDLTAISNGDYVYLGITDEGGFNTWNNCSFYNTPTISNSLALLISLGSREITNICYRDGWAMFFKKGESIPIFEKKSTNERITNSFTTTLVYSNPHLEVGKLSSSSLRVKIEGPANLNYDLRVSSNFTNWNTSAGVSFDPISARYVHDETLNSTIGSKKFFKLNE